MKMIFFLLLISAQAYASWCDVDEKKFCQNLTGARGEVYKCLTEHSSEIAPGCLKELRDFKQRSVKKNPCFQDLIDYCPDVPNHFPNLHFCLLKNASRLSQGCLLDFEPKKVLLQRDEPCTQDILEHCYKEVSGPNGSITRCLFREKKKLSKICLPKVEQKIVEMKKNNPCFDDTEKFCPTPVKAIDIQECLEKKLKALSSQCRPVVQEEMNLAASNPCYKDLRRWCRPNLTPSQQDTCLGLSHKDLSPACRDYRKSEDQKIEKMRVACEIDRLKYCKEAPFKDGLVLDCLKSNKLKLSKECQGYL